MKLKIGLSLVSLCGLCSTVVVGQNGDATQSARVPAVSASPNATASASVDTSPALTRAEALKIVTESRQYVAHPETPRPEGKVSEPKVKMPDFEMLDAPPAPRVETKPAAPGPGLVWVEGHYMPVKGVWRWVRGEWAVPATTISVWIPARYEAEEKKWSPGYWQPDAPAAPPAASATTKDATGATPAPPPARY